MSDIAPCVIINALDDDGREHRIEVEYRWDDEPAYDAEFEAWVDGDLSILRVTDVETGEHVQLHSVQINYVVDAAHEAFVKDVAGARNGRGR